MEVGSWMHSYQNGFNPLVSSLNQPALLWSIIALLICSFKLWGPVEIVCVVLVFMVFYSLILISTNSSLAFPQCMYFSMKLINWYVKFSLTVADSPSFSTRCAADESFSSRFKTHVFYIPKNWLTLSHPVRECNLDKHKLVAFFQKIDIFFDANSLVIIYL